MRVAKIQIYLQIRAEHRKSEYITKQQMKGSMLICWLTGKGPAQIIQIDFHVNEVLIRIENGLQLRKSISE